MTLPGKQISASELSEFFGVTPPTVRAWADAGMPYLKRGGKGREWVFNSRAVHDWLVETELRRKGVGGPVANDKTSLTHRKSLAETEMRELELARKVGDVAPIGLFIGIIGLVFDKVNAKLSAVANRTAPLVAVETDVTKCHRIIERVVDEARNELVGPTPDSLRNAASSDSGIRGAMREVQAYTKLDSEPVG